MFHLGSEQTQIVFRDVAAYFSEAEWKRLPQRQKELYTNVMKEIHKALLYIGYQIINPDILLRVNKGKESYTPDLKDPERKECLDDLTLSWYPTVHPDILFRIKEAEEPCFRNGCDTEKKEIGNSHSKAVHQSINDNILIRGTKGRDVCTPDLEDAARKDYIDSLTSSWCPTVQPDVLFRNEQEELYLGHGCDIEEIEIGTSHSKDYEIINNDVLLRGNKGEEAYTPGLEDPTRKDYLDNLTSSWYVTAHPANVFINKEEELCLGPGCDIEKIEIGKSHSKGAEKKVEILPIEQKNYEKICSHNGLAVRPFSIKEEGETGSMDYQVSERRESSSSATGNETMNTKMNDGESLKCFKKAPICEMSTESVKVEMRQNSEKGTTLIGQLWSESNAELGEKTIQCEGGFNKPSHSYWGIPIVEVSDACNAYASELVDTKHACLQSTQHQTTHMGTRPYQCTECDNSFEKKSDYNIHQRTHIGGRPYKCSDCDKSFILKRQLIRHQRSHTGDRPFQCSECGRSYPEKGTLNRHYRRTHSFSLKEDAMKCKRNHTRERLYQCTKCEKSFSQKEEHSKHQSTHTGKGQLSNRMITHVEETKYHCTECDRSFKRIYNFNIHQRTHTKEGPYQCPECEKSFSNSQEFLKHQRAHTSRKKSLEAMTCQRKPNLLEPVRWTIEGGNELVSVSSNAGSTIW